LVVVGLFCQYRSQGPMIGEKDSSEMTYYVSSATLHLLFFRHMHANIQSVLHDKHYLSDMRPSLYEAALRTAHRLSVCPVPAPNSRTKRYIEIPKPTF